MADTQSTSMLDIMKLSLNSTMTRNEKLYLRESALSHKESLLDGVSFLGRLLEDHSVEAKTQPDFGRDEMLKLGAFLSSAIELVKCMDGVIDSCKL